jgi:hypothetical protein
MYLKLDNLPKQKNNVTVCSLLTTASENSLNDMEFGFGTHIG